MTAVGLHEMSVEFWQRNQVVHLPVPITADESFRALEQRNSLYPGFTELMPVDYPGRRVLDYGCGPGHDVIRFLRAGARHVTAADVSSYGLGMLQARLDAHRWRERCTIVKLDDRPWTPPVVDVVFVNGVLHHCADPVGTLRLLRDAITDAGVIHLMVYAAESWFVRVRCGGDPAVFEDLADGAAPIAKAWTRAEVAVMAGAAGLKAEYVGSYLMQEPEGPGLGGCWRLNR